MVKALVSIMARAKENYQSNQAFVLLLCSSHTFVNAVP